MNNINLLIVASSDMDGTNDNFNLPNDVLNITYPCNKYNGKLLKEKEKTTIKSPRCNKCHYTEVEHKYGYPLFPLHPVKLKEGEYYRTLSCNHTFHKKCIDLWKVKGGMTCPMCRKNIDETKFKVILTIENTQTHQINSTPLNINSILSAFGNINLDDPFFLTQMSMNIDSERDLEQLLRELNVELADIETLSFV